MQSNDTIFAIATPPGTGGVGVIRVSGQQAPAIARIVTGKNLENRRAEFCRFSDADGSIIDTGIAIFFQAPASFTGEDVVELQGHAGPVVQQMISRRLLELGVRQARAGEFSERAFLNNKLDLAQAEAIADLVASGTESAARAAQRSLDGVFSERIHHLQAALTDLRVFVEAALDFPDEEIDFIAESDVLERLQACQDRVQKLLNDAHHGQILRDGVTVAIIGLPNAGKSSLLNALSGRDSAIVTDIPGTTRDVLRETVSLDGLPVHIADTAGIRESVDIVEAEGVRRARAALGTADIALLVLDPDQELDPQLALKDDIPAGVIMIEVHNKIDLSEGQAEADIDQHKASISARTGAGIEGLIGIIQHAAGLGNLQEGSFSARVRHLDALRRTLGHLQFGKQQLEEFNLPEILAEELKMAQKELGEITGEVLPDDLLGSIFSSFCIGK